MKNEEWKNKGTIEGAVYRQRDGTLACYSLGKIEPKGPCPNGAARPQD